MEYTNQRLENLVKAIDQPLSLKKAGKRLVNRLCDLPIALCIFLCGITDANAYIDPGSSLLVLQGVLAAVGGILIFIRHPLKATRNAFSKLKKFLTSKNKDSKDA